MAELTPKTPKDVIRKVFSPGVRCHRVHGKDGWADTIEIGLVQLRVRVYNERARVGLHWVEPGTAVVSILGVRQAHDGSTTVLWRASSDTRGGLQGALEAARGRLLGLAAGFLAVCGETGVANVQPALGPPAEDEDLAGDAIDDLLDAVQDNIGKLVR